MKAHPPPGHGAAAVTRSAGVVTTNRKRLGACALASAGGAPLPGSAGVSPAGAAGVPLAAARPLSRLMPNEPPATSKRRKLSATDCLNNVRKPLAWLPQA